MMPTSSSNGKRFVMVTIVGLLLASGALRSGLVGIAVAGNDAITENEVLHICKPTDDIETLLGTVKNRAEELTAWEADLATQTSNLEAARIAINKKLAELKAAEASLKQTVAFVEGAAEDDLTKLTTVYEQMKPKTAVPLFEQMTPSFAAGFLSRMRPDAAAPILAGLSSEHAYAISVILAGRNAGAPKQ